MHNPKGQSRRHFIKTATVAGIAVPFIASNWASGASPNGKLQHACIGVGGMGGNDLENFLAHNQAQIVALCDVDENTLKAAGAKVPGARLYRDWRELLAKEGNKIDSVNIAVPDHMHFPIAYTAIKAGKNVYCQKPLCHDVAEIRRLTEATAKAKVVTQLGTQFASGSGDRTAVSLLKAGVIGKAKHAYLCSNRRGSDSIRLLGPRPAQGQPVPATLNWDLWLGNAPERPYAPGIYHPAFWRTWQDFGTGWSGDIGCHIFDAVWKGLDLKAPKTVVADVQESWKNSPVRRADTWPQTDHIVWTFPQNEHTDGELTVEWFDGLESAKNYPPKDIQSLFAAGDYPEECAMVVGTEGAILIPHQKQPWLLPEDKFKSHKVKQIESRNHYHHFVDACLGKTKTESHFEQTGPMAEAIILGTVAIRVPDQKLEWDAAKCTVTNCPDAVKYLSREYRNGWGVEEV